ncbi:DKNYY domain-containing protein [Capnocytophaga sp. oral taxon 878]|uniref:DKNYY domain-containing protein n=1 Tax=Capnocytophaga sp. oral taxon 878 TaxID=1316596 RepID=UPI000D042433|nr:DKNYY domain-containing protein [Capnocytophaga sp. oral taxon 878]AVM49456.1 DKNYY family protein [Capnocytophaga sp. oral taxon 878]
MKHFLLLTSLFLFASHSYAQKQIVDAKKVEQLTMQQDPNDPCRYVKGYIVNKDYIIYQNCNQRIILPADTATFELQNEDFALDKNGVYYQGKFFSVDTTGFKIIGEKEVQNEDEKVIIWRTNQKVFFGQEPVKVAHPATFEEVFFCYFKDKEFIYYWDKKIEGSDSQSIITCGDVSAIADKNHTYYKGKILSYKGEPVTLINNVLFKTSHHVLGLTLDSGDDTPTWEELPNIDVASLKRLSDSYAIDKNAVFFNDSQMSIKKEDFANLRIFEEPYVYRFITDGKAIYKGGSKTKYHLPTFGIFTNTSEELCYDKNGVYKDEEKLPFKYTDSPLLGKNLFLIKKIVVYKQQAYNIDYDSKKFYPHVTPEMLEEFKYGKKQAITIRYGKLQPKFNIHTLPLRESYLSTDDEYLYYLHERLIKKQNLELLAIYKGYDSQDDDVKYHLFKNVEGYWLAQLKNRNSKICFLGTKLNKFKL